MLPSMTVNEVRSRYLEFFKSRGHAIIPSAPIVPENDPTTLFTSSGMQPLVPYLLGQPHPEGARLADSQLSFRAEDIEEVGDNRHTTFFEMLGNWSLGDYFKAEQLPWFFEFLTNKEAGLGLDPQNLYVTVFGGDAESKMEKDDESVGIWQTLFKEKGIEAPFKEMGTEAEAAEKGMADEQGKSARIFSYGAKKNWWSRSGVPAKMPPGEIGGPDSEVFYDFGLPHDGKFGRECHPNCDCGRFIEIGNSVFIQYLKQPDGSFKELPKKNVDFGGGLERLAAATRANPDVFLTDVFEEARRVLEARSGKRYGDDASATRSYRIILDHMRAASFMLATGVVPGNSEQPYVLRRLIRRSIREADKLGIKDAVLAEVAEGYGDAYAEAYPFVKANAAFIREQLEKEEAQFRKTLAQGLREFDKHVGRPTSHIEPAAAFELYTTYGFPLEMTAEMVAERGLTLDMDAVGKLMDEHQAKSRAGAAQKFAGGLADHQEQTIKYHTAHHLLLKALQKVLGPEVHQRGSNITSERMRMDFSFARKMTPEEIAEAERIVNEKIAEALPVTRTVMPKAEAEKLGAEHEFGASYPEQVSVYSVGPKGASEADPKFSEAFSIEFCGGPHVENTAELGEGGKQFKIAKEEASSAGVRRIRAVLQ
ncbi:MAG: alanine--tRNA ligase [Patescibacteria group bacterium]|nr:alanine--tRNA ligase [Patescibacteria group bacterium]MDE1943880.1 alanine--tRNA ligase [Patescibacteria group bacterium]MDE1944958.1 alanine--tRNA ligase [Patescibacteria group bacterium]MDE2057991.1 alanine--tRNA ligase [Patescibacteria group bacterium]